MYAYLSSMAAVNVMYRSLSVYLNGRSIVVVLILHSGLSNTRPGTSTHGVKETVEADNAACGPWKFLREKGREDMGKF